MMTRLQLLVVLFLFNSGCAEMKVADFKGGVTLPYSEDCYQISVVTKQEVRTSAEACRAMVKRSVFITSDDYRLLRETIQNNCQVLKCKQLVGQFDQLFLTIDKNLQLIPWQ